MLVGAGLGGQRGFDGPEVTGVRMYQRGATRELLDDREELPSPSLHPPDREELREVPRIGICVAHLASQPMTLRRGLLGITEAARPHEQHRVDRGDNITASSMSN